jgi:uncharacterized membrane protein
MKRYLLICTYVFEFLIGAGVLAGGLIGSIALTGITGNFWWLALLIPTVFICVAIAFLIMRTLDYAFDA